MYQSQLFVDSPEEASVGGPWASGWIHLIGPGISSSPKPSTKISFL